MESFIGTKKFKDVLKYLLEIDHHLPDDTLLNRLLDFIQLYVTVENFESSDLKSFLEEVTKKHSKIEPSVLSFSLSLCGKLCEATDILTEYYDVITKLLDEIKPFVGDSSIASAYFTCLTSMVKHPHGLQYVNQHEEFPNLVLERMKNGESIFVKNAASDLIYTLLNLPQESMITSSSRLSESLLSDLESFSQNNSNNINYVSCILSLLYKLSDSVTWKQTAATVCYTRVLYSCLQLYQTLPKSYIQLISEVIIKYLTLIDDREKEEFINKVENDIKLLVKVDVVKSHHVACNLIQICPGLKDIVCIPSDIIMNGSNGYLSLSKSVLSSTILQYLSRDTNTVTMNEQIDLIIKCLKIIQDKDNHHYKQYLINNKLLLSKILHHLHNKLEKSRDVKEERLSEIYGLLLDAVSPISTDITTLKFGTSCMLLILSQMTWKELDLTQFIRVLEMKLCDTGWEIRDTALEIINQLVSIVKDDSEYQVILPLCCTGWSSRTDSHSYVKASVITLISTIVTHKTLLHQFLSLLDIKIEDIVLELTTILKEDSEAFPRRSAVKTLDNISQTCYSLYYQVDIYSAMLNAMEDFDWEVKLLVLTFWEHAVLKPLEHNGENGVENDVPSYACGLTESTKQNNNQNTCPVPIEFCKSLLLGFNDYEQSVKEKACEMIKRFLKIWVNNQTDNSKDVIPWIDKLQCLNTDNSIVYNSDEYNKNPLSLLDDILATAGEQDEDNFVDCY